MIEVDFRKKKIEGECAVLDSDEDSDEENSSSTISAGGLPVLSKPERRNWQITFCSTFWEDMRGVWSAWGVLPV